MNTELRVKLASFEGPLDLLLYLCQKDELDIRQIQIAQITDPYLRALDLMRDYNLDIAGDFLLMASTLIWLKSKTLLPQTDLAPGEEDGILTEDELRRRLLDHQRYRAMAQDFKSIPLLGNEAFKRPLPEEKEKREALLKEMNLTDLTVAFQQVLLRARKPALARIKRDPLTIAEAVQRIVSKLASSEVTEFQSLFGDEPDRNEMVVTFLAILELGRLGKLRVLQHVAYGSIYLVLRESLEMDSLQQLFAKGDAYAYRAAESTH